MNEYIRDPREDISLIKSMLEKTTDGMKSVAPWFTGFGVIWLIFGILTVLQRLVMFGASLSTAQTLSLVNAVLNWLFFSGLVVGFFICRRRQVRQGLDSIALKLVDIWGVCIVLFIALSIGLSFLPGVAVRFTQQNIEQVQAVGIACALVRSHLFFVLPMIPLLATAVFMENRRMLHVGAGLAAIAALILGGQTLMYCGDELSLGAAWVIAWTLTVCLLDIAPGVMLLVFGRQLKRM